MREDYCKCEPRARIGMRKYHPTEYNSFLIGRPIIEYCIYCGKEKLKTFIIDSVNKVDGED